jgi:hypothetical protein
MMRKTQHAQKEQQEKLALVTEGLPVHAVRVLICGPDHSRVRGAEVSQNGSAR